MEIDRLIGEKAAPGLRPEAVSLFSISTDLHAHRLVRFVHVFHALGVIAGFHRRLRLIERRRRFLLLGGIGHLGNHPVHLLHMLVIAQILGGKGRAKRGPPNSHHLATIRP